jgi:hypothetical protein
MRRFASLTTSNLRFARRYDEAIQTTASGLDCFVPRSDDKHNQNGKTSKL